MNRFAVFGNPIAHSLSPWIHQQFAHQTGMTLTYEKILGDPEQFEQQVHHFFDQGGKGLNITLPFKIRAFALAGISTIRCAQAQAANTLWIQEGQMHADNTDGAGLLRDLARYTDLKQKSVLVSGAGGAARGIIGPLLAEGADVVLVNRSMDKAYAFLDNFPQLRCQPMEALDPEFDVIINATSAGLMDQQIGLPPRLLHNHPLCYDLAYRAEGLTPFLIHARDQGCVAVDGLGMLVEQAAEAFFIWHGVCPETAGVLSELRYPFV
jgi:shikimate dehydrogenase